MRFLKPTHAQLQKWASLDQARKRKAENLFLAEGVKIVEEALQSAWKMKALLIREDRREHFGEMPAIRSVKLDAYALTDREWRRLSQDKSSEGIIAVASVPPMPAVRDLTTEGDGRMLLLYEINNPNNLGALLRAADWFGFETVLLSRGSVDFTHPKVVRTSMGSLFHLAVIADVDFARVLPGLRSSHRLIGSDVRSGAAPHAIKGAMALMLGSESQGLPKELTGLADEIWRIPGSGRAESLSLPQAAAILMYACTAAA
ncbi:MAG: putative TrmH family tRNA/rRNA methyltransferase [Syntrophaceae bacterium PtaB.Bin095]|jgi:TrmH family RNA methyltransferase|nr:MAG: putative TrmH family tRNA/rRNA methyltransferase [Syntrophaceae bacterium PtaB.Bin095]